MLALSGDVSVWNTRKGQPVLGCPCPTETSWWQIQALQQHQGKQNWSGRKTGDLEQSKKPPERGARDEGEPRSLWCCLGSSG